jgi:tetratricopeptide (TPR) repeat protein
MPLKRASIRRAARSGLLAMGLALWLPVAAGARDRRLGLDELVSLVDALEARGLPDRALRAMDEFRFNFADSPDYWSRFAQLYDNAGKLEQALACLEQVSRMQQPQVDIEQAVAEARLLWRLGRPESALTRLFALRGLANQRDTDYWRLLAELAWLENDVLASEAYAVLWKHEKTAEVAHALLRTLEALGRIDEAIDTAQAAWSALGKSEFLVTALDLAMQEGRRGPHAEHTGEAGQARLDRARQLITAARPREKQLAGEPRFWWLRARLAVADGLVAEAERDLRRVLALDPGATEARVEWLRLAVRARDRGTARRVLQQWPVPAPGDAETLALLAEVHALLGEDERALHYRGLARQERRRARIAEGRSMSPEERVEEALEDRDRAALELSLRLHAGQLSLPARVGALRELDRDDEAWALLRAAGVPGTGAQAVARLAHPDLAADVLELRDDYLDGAWTHGGRQVLGGLDERRIGARVDLRMGPLFVGLDSSVAWLRGPNLDRLATPPIVEQRAALRLRIPQRSGETVLRAGVEFLPHRRQPQGELSQQLTLLADRLEIQLRGAYGEVPTRSALTRLATRRDGGELEVLAVLAGPFEVGGAAALGRFRTHSNEHLTDERAGRAELALRIPVRDAYLRPRLDVSTSVLPPLEDIPAALQPWITHDEDPRDLLSLGHTSAGLGLQLGTIDAGVGEGRGSGVHPPGRHRMHLRYALDLWTGYRLPDRRRVHAVEAAAGLAFAERQEISADGFYFAGRYGARERHWGLSLAYTLRWLR